MIKIENIGKVFNPHSRNRNEVLKDVSFELPDTGLIAIYGKSGSGKTTLLNIIGGLDKQDTGKIYIDNEEVKNNVDKVRNQNIGFVFQNYYLENGYTIEQIMHNAMVIAGFKDEKEIKKRSKEVLELVDMERFKHKQADSLSGGQKQRVAIARALIKGADIILADEPTGNLDAYNTMKIMDIFKEISKTNLVLIVTHEVTLIKKYADSYIQLVDGKLTDDDVIGEVFKYETEKNNIYINEDDYQLVQNGNINFKAYGDPEINDKDLEIYGKDGKIYLQASKNVTIIDSQSEKKIIFTNKKEEKNDAINKVVPSFEKSKSKKNGKLFNLKNISKAMKNSTSERIYSTANIFKQVFVAIIAIVMSFFTLMTFEVLNKNIDNKTVNENNIYLNLNTFTDIKKLDPSLYDKVDFFETKLRSGKFSYNNLTALSGIKANYSPKAIETSDTKESVGLVYGEMPKEKQVLITRALAEKLKNEFRIKELNSDKAILLVLFENDYAVSGIVEGTKPIVLMHKQDYINFLGVYNAIQFVDPEQIFFNENYINNSYSTEIIALDDELMNVDEVYVELSRNALYKMMDNTLDADYNVQVANSKLRKNSGRTGLEIKNSNLYVRKFSITRETLKADIRLYIHKDALKNIFVYLEPNIDALKGNNSKNDSNFYFEITTKDNNQFEKLSNKIKDSKIKTVDILKEYKFENKEMVRESIASLSTFLLVMVLLFFIYYFMEKSGSIKNSKEYGIYRAIGVNKSNLLFKETITTLINNMITYFVCFLIAIILMCIRYTIMNVNIFTFILLGIGIFIISTLIMIGISLVPYLFVLKETPSEILSRYDI